MLVEHADALDSTHLEARRRVDAGDLHEPIAIVAATQTGGIGRFGRPWSSPRGGLWLTCILPAPSNIPAHLGLAVGVALIDACERAAPSSTVDLKWPNDLMRRDRKLGGILIEQRKKHLLIGVGINANAPPLPADTLAPLHATAFDTPVALSALEHAVIGAVGQTVNATPGLADTVARARARLWGIGRILPVTLPDGTRLHARVLALDDTGGLLIEPVDTQSGQRTGAHRVLHAVDRIEW